MSKKGKPPSIHYSQICKKSKAEEKNASVLLHVSNISASKSLCPTFYNNEVLKHNTEKLDHATLSRWSTTFSYNLMHMAQKQPTSSNCLFVIQ